MSVPSSYAPRARFQHLIEEGSSRHAAALRLKVTPSLGARWILAIRCTVQASAATQERSRGKSKLDPYRSYLFGLIDQDGDRTVSDWAGERADALARFLRKFGFTY